MPSAVVGALGVSNEFIIAIVSFAAMKLELACPVACTDGPYGVLDDVVIDPISGKVTHLVVQREHRHDLARLVPIERAEADDHGIKLGCTAAELDAFDHVQESSY